MEQNQTHIPYFRGVLAKDLQRKKNKNPRYSLRAYAKSLGCDPGALSRILSGKQSISSALATKIIHKLALNPDEQRHFLTSILQEKKEKAALELAMGLNASELIPPRQEIPSEVFEKIADLETVAILECCALEDFQSDPQWIAERLDIAVDSVEKRLETLESVGLLQKQDGRWIKTSPHLRVNFLKAAAAYNRQQKQILKRALKAVESDTIPAEARIMKSVTMAIDPSRLSEAQKMSKGFTEELCDFLEQGKKTQVYQLVFHMFPVSQPVVSQSFVPESASAETSSAATAQTVSAEPTSTPAA